MRARVSYWVKYQGTRFPVRRGETILGRSPYCTVVVNNGQVSREHCALRLNAEGLEVVDLGSTNGVTVNGLTIEQRQKLNSGDVFGVGSELLEVIEVDGEIRSAARQTTRSSQQSLPMMPMVPADDDTLTQSDTLELLEALVRNAKDDQSASLTLTIQRALDDLVARPGASGLGQRGRDRVEALSRELCRWSGDDSVDGWRERLLRRLRVDP